MSSAVVYPKVDPKEWAEKYGIHPRKGLCCPVCKKEVVPSVPFAFKGVRGLETADHGCKANGCPAVMVPVGEDAREWKALIKGLTEVLKP